MTKKRFRMQFRFWLDGNRPDEAELAEAIEDLKAKRSFARAIRQGLKLWLSLTRGDTSVLIELFPWVEEKMASSRKNEGDNGNHDLAALFEELHALRAEVARGNSGGMLHRPAMATEVRTDDLVLKRGERDTSNINPAENFMNSIRAFLPGVLEPATAPPASKGPKIMATPTFEAPSFDDLEL